MKNWFFIAAIFLLLMGCATVEFVRKDLAPHKQGILRFATTSSASKSEKYRQKVDKMASEFCGGKYQITREYQAKDYTGTSTGVGTGVGTGLGFGVGGLMLGGSSADTAMYNFVEFSCESDG